MEAQKTDEYIMIYHSINHYGDESVVKSVLADGLKTKAARGLSFKPDPAIHFGQHDNLIFFRPENYYFAKQGNIGKDVIGIKIKKDKINVFNQEAFISRTKKPPSCFYPIMPYDEYIAACDKDIKEKFNGDSKEFFNVAYNYKTPTGEYSPYVPEICINPPGGIIPPREFVFIKIDGEVIKDEREPKEKQASVAPKEIINEQEKGGVKHEAQEDAIRIDNKRKISILEHFGLKVTSTWDSLLNRMHIKTEKPSNALDGEHAKPYSRSNQA